MSNLNSADKKHLAWIDYSKGLAILAIVFYHFFQNYRDGSQFVQLVYDNTNILAFVAVDIFFIIAGFNTSLSVFKLLNKPSEKAQGINWLTWLKKRLIRLYPTYWLAILFTLILFLVCGKTLEVRSFWDFILIAIGWPGYVRYRMFNPGFWFFSVILQAYLIIPLLFLLCKNRPLLILLAGLGLGFMTKILCLYSVSGNFPAGYAFLQNNWILSYIFPLCLGIYWGFIYQREKGFRAEDWIWSSFAFFSGLILFVLLTVSGTDVMYMLGFDLFLSPLSMLLCYWVCQQIIDRIPILNQGIAIIGIHSYEIFLLHQTLFFVLLYPLIALPFPQTPKLFLSLIITTIILTLYVILFIQIDGRLKRLIDAILKARRVG